MSQNTVQFYRKILQTQEKIRKKLKNSSKKLKKSAFFETLFAGNASKKEAWSNSKSFKRQNFSIWGTLSLRYKGQQL